MKAKKRILLLGELYRPLIPWFLEGKEPKGVPAVYNLYKYLSNSDTYYFHSIIYNPSINTKRTFPNGSVLELKKFSFPNYYLWKLIVFFKLLLFGNRILKIQAYDLIYGLSTFSAVAAILGKRHRIPSVGRIYGTILTKDVKNKNYFRLYTRFIFDILSIKIPASKVICTMDGTEYDKVFHFFNKKGKVNLLYNGMDKAHRRQLLSYPLVSILPTEETIKLCYIARLETYKRQELAIELVDQLVNKYQIINLELNIVGTGSRAGFLKKMVKEKGLDNYIIFKAEIPHLKIMEFLKSQHASLFFYEGGSLGNILWESGLAGKLIIAVDNGATGELFKDGKNSIIAGDDEYFVENIAQKLSGYIGQDISSLTAASRSLVEHHIKTWEERFDLEFEHLFEGKPLPIGNSKPVVNL